LPGLTRQSIFFAKMDHRVTAPKRRPGDDAELIKPLYRGGITGSSR
jgi:hypothetical protein